ncbi:Uncharacterised protein [Mycobacteroides abscessus subsp. abscessus]|nr:Uncharacterised protein [Mycobacteroides abscessus subsp. abscessus]
MPVVRIHKPKTMSTARRASVRELLRNNTMPRIASNSAVGSSQAIWPPSAG